MFAHQIGTVRPRRRTDRRDADQHDQNEPGFQNFGIGLSAHEAARPISDMQRADAGDSELERRKKSCKLDQPNRTKIEQPADAEQKLRAPHILKAVTRRGQNPERFVSPEQCEIESNQNDNRCGDRGTFLHGFLPDQGPRLIVSNAKFKRNRNFTLPAGPLTLAR